MNSTEANTRLVLSIKMPLDSTEIRFRLLLEKVNTLLDDLFLF